MDYSNRDERRRQETRGEAEEFSLQNSAPIPEVLDTDTDVEHTNPGMETVEVSEGYSDVHSEGERPSRPSSLTQKPGKPWTMDRGTSLQSLFQTPSQIAIDEAKIREAVGEDRAAIHKERKPRSKRAAAGDLSVHVSRLDIRSTDKAREIAEFVLDELDADVQQFLEKHPPGKKRIYQKSVSSISITSQTQDTAERLYANEPSTMDMWYEKRENELKMEPFPPLPEGGTRAEAETQVHLHRSHKRFGRKEPLPLQDTEAQTREMTMLSKGEAERVFRHMYPLKDDYVPPKVPSRQASMQFQIDEAKQAPDDVDRVQVGAKVKWNKKPRVLPPLPQDYNKVESFWTGSTFEGKYVNREFDHGRFNYPLMSTYESEFHNGQIESRKHLGLVKYPRGDRFEGNWRRGRYLAGRITFCDDLDFSPHRWNYCTPQDRRFYIERDVGLKQAGRTLYNDRLPPPVIPPGCYDTGDGIYDPETGLVTSFTGLVLRTADSSEVKWIMTKCRKSKEVQERYTPCFNVDRLPCSYTEKHVKM